MLEKLTQFSFGVCFSNILTGILLANNVLGGSTPILYTIDCKMVTP